MAAAYCPCRGAGEKRKPLFNPKHLALCRNGDTTSDENRMELVQWLDEWKPANYTPAFDDYNNDF